MDEFKEMLKNVIMITGIMFFSHLCVWLYAYYGGLLVINGGNAGLLDLLKGLSISLVICIVSAFLFDTLLQIYGFLMKRIR